MLSHKSNDPKKDYSKIPKIDFLEIFNSAFWIILSELGIDDVLNREETTKIYNKICEIRNKYDIEDELKTNNKILAKFGDKENFTSNADKIILKIKENKEFKEYIEGIKNGNIKIIPIFTLDMALREIWLIREKNEIEKTIQKTKKLVKTITNFAWGG